MDARTNPIERLEIAAERCKDLTPPGYRRLSASTPQAETRSEESAELVEGSMPALTIDAMLGFCRRPHRPLSHDPMRSLLARRLRHAARIVQRFFGVIANTIRELVELTGCLSQRWWRRLLGEIDAAIAQSDLLTEG